MIGIRRFIYRLFLAWFWNPDCESWCLRFTRWGRERARVNLRTGEYYVWDRKGHKIVSGQLHQKYPVNDFSTLLVLVGGK